MKILFFANTDWYLYNYRIALAKTMKKMGYEVLLISPHGKYVEEFKKEDLQWREFNLNRKGMNPLDEFLTILRLIILLSKEKPDITHFFTIKPVIYGSLAARFCQIPKIINSIPGLGYVFSGKNTTLRIFVEALYRFCLHKTKIIFQNPDDLSYFTQNSIINKKNAFLIPGSGVDIVVFHPTPEPTDVPIVMLGGRLLRTKGIPEFIEAAHQIKMQGIASRFVIVGEPYPDNPDSIKQEELDPWRNNGTIETWGWHDNMHSVISQASIICLPTSYKEGLPRLLLEAGACGRPVVATNIPGCKMVVRAGENGILIQPGNINELVESLRTLLQDSNLRKLMGDKGREIVVNEFSVENIIKKTIEVYNLP